jgi:hypothetical protein
MHDSEFRQRCQLELLAFPSDEELKEILSSKAARNCFIDRKEFDSIIYRNGLKLRLAVVQDGSINVECVVLYLMPASENFDGILVSK